MPPMPPSIFNMHFARDDNPTPTNTSPPNPSQPPRDPPPNAALIAGATTTVILGLFILAVVILPWLKRRSEVKKKKQTPSKSRPSAVSQFLAKSSRFDRSFHGHRRAPSGLDIPDLTQAYMPDNRRPPVHDPLPFQAEREREIPAVHFRDQPDEIRQIPNDRPVSHQYYIPPPNAYVDNPFPPTPGTGRNTGRRDDAEDPFADQPPSSQLHPYHDIGLESASPSPKVSDDHWDQYHQRGGQQSARSVRTPHTNGLTPRSVPGNSGETGEASPLTAYINHLNGLGDPPATAPAFQTFATPPVPRSAGLPYEHQQPHQQAYHQAQSQQQQLRARPSFDHGVSSGSDYSDSPTSRTSRSSSGAHLSVQGYGPGTRGVGYDQNIPHSMPTQGHVSFAHEQSLARAKAAKNGAGTALRNRFGGNSPRPSPGVGGGHSGFHSAGLPSPAHLSANPNKSHFSPMTPDYRQSRMPLESLPEVPNSSIAYGFALPPSPLSPGDEIVVSPSPYHSSFAMNR